MRCSARSFSSASSARSLAVSSSGVAPRGRVPARGRVSTRRPSTRTSISGEAPATAACPSLRKYMYGDGFTILSARYTVKGSTEQATSRRRESTTWKMSPAAMYSLARRTESAKADPSAAEASTT